MNALFENFPDYSAPAGCVTFTVVDQAGAGHSVSISAGEYGGVLRATKSALSDMNDAIVFSGAIKIIRHKVGCSHGCREGDDDALLGAFIAAALKHPNKAYRKVLMSSISDMLRKEGGAHVILIMPPAGSSIWLLAAPAAHGDAH